MLARVSTAIIITERLVLSGLIDLSREHQRDAILPNVVGTRIASGTVNTVRAEEVMVGLGGRPR